MKEFHWHSYLVLFIAISLSLNLSDLVLAQQIGQPVPSWKPGMLDIYQLNTGKGDCAFFILPDGTTMVFDAGEMNMSSPRTTGPRTAAVKPNDTKLPGEWLAFYMSKLLEQTPEHIINYAIISHFHDDHMGAPSDLSPMSSNGKYKLTGITAVGDKIPIRTMIDRGWPNYDYPEPVKNPMVNNYRAFTDWQMEHNGMSVQQFEAGKHDQIRLVYHPEEYPGFIIQNISVNGEVWTGVSDIVRAQFPLVTDLQKAGQALPGENPCSISLRLSYGKFDYYTGGDLPGVLDPGEPLWSDVETQVAKAVGPVEVNVLNHHGNRDSENAFFVGTLRPQVDIIPVWSSDHPGPGVLQRLLSTYIYPGPRDIFATNMLESNYLVIGERLKQLKSAQGHILVRVDPGGAIYHVIILDDSNTALNVKSVFGPYRTR